MTRSRLAALRFVCSLFLATLALAPLAAAAEKEDREPPPLRLPREQFIEMQRAIGPRAELASHGPQILAGPTLNWTELGPKPIGYEYWSTGPASGRVSAIAVNPSNGDIAYIAAAQGGVWKTTNGGASWTVLTDGLSSISSGALALDPANASIVYYGTGELHDSFDSFYGDGLFRSPDAGASWSHLATRDQVGAYIARVAVNRSNSNILYVAGSLGVVRSIDGGANWAATLNDDWCYDLVQDPTHANILYAALYAHGVYKTTNGGASWTRLTGGLPAIGAGYQRINLAIAPSNPLVLYASYVDPNGVLFAMYRTADGGTTWSTLPGTPDYLEGQGWYDNCVVVDPSDANKCFAGGLYPYDVGYFGVIKTVNGGTSWSDITFGVDGFAVHPDQHFMTFGPDGRLWLGNDGGVWRTSDAGAHWTNCNNGLAITQFYEAAIHPTIHDRILGGTQDNGTEMYGGVPVWPQIVSGDGGYCLFLWNDPATYLTTYVYLNPVWEFNAGGYVGDITGPWGPASDRASFLLGPLVQDQNTANTVLAGTYRVWRTNNLGGTWSALSGDLPGGTAVMRSIAVAQGAPNTIYAGTSNGLLYVTTNAATWNLRSTGLPAAPINDIWIDPADAQTAYISTDLFSGPKVWKTTNAGVFWSDVSGDMPANLRGMCLAVDYGTTPPRLYVGTDYGVYSSTSGGLTWLKENASGMPSLVVYDLELIPGGGIIAATHGRGMWRGTTSLVAVGDNGAQDRQLTLAAVNPARAPSRIDYRLPQPAQVALEVYDLSGRRVRVIERGSRPAGEYHASWDGRDDAGVRVQDGIYFYRLNVGSASRVVKFALLK